MKKALTFFLVFTATAAFVFVLVVGPNYSAFKSLFTNTDGMAEGSEFVENTFSLKRLTEFIGEHPEFVSIVSYNVEHPDSGIFYGEHLPRTMGTLGNLFLLIEYERQISEGILSADEEINMAEVERYALPEINQNDHKGTIEFLNKLDGPVTLDHAMQAVLQFRSLALADYFWFRLGEENLRALMDSLALPNTEMPVPFSGIYTVIHPKLVTHPTDARQHFNDLNEIPRKELFSRMIDAARYYAEHEEAQFNRKKLMESKRLAMSFIEERDALAFFPKTTARDITDVLYKLWHNELLSPEISQAVKEKLRWSMNSDPIQRSFRDYGALYDNRMGMLSGLDFGTSIYDGHTSVQAVFFDELPVAFWLHMSANHMQEDYQQRLIWGPALYETTKAQTEQ